MGDYVIYMAIMGVFGVLGAVVSGRLKSKFNHYSQVPLSNGMSGADVAKKMLAHYGIHDVTVNSVDGFLSDHYNPANKTVNLSPAVYSGRSVAAAAVAAHECGHAVQHATAYSMLQMRSKMVPVVNIAANLQQFLLIGALGIAGATGNSTMLIACIAVFGVTALFSVITLPVEFDASNRALVWLDETGFARGEEYDGAKDALKWAAMTYVVAALSAIAMVLFFVLKLLSAQNRQ